MTTYRAANTSADQLKTRIQSTPGLLYSEQKFQVTAFDIDARKVEPPTAKSVDRMPFPQSGESGQFSPTPRIWNP
jgi:hypothetical protein